METYNQPREEQRFGAGLSEAEVLRFQSILRDQCGINLPLPDAWGRAIELLSLVELLLEDQGILAQTGKDSSEFAVPRS